MSDTVITLDVLKEERSREEHQQSRNIESILVTHAVFNEEMSTVEGFARLDKPENRVISEWRLRVMIILLSSSCVIPLLILHTGNRYSEDKTRWGTLRREDLRGVRVTRILENIELISIFPFQRTHWILDLKFLKVFSILTSHFLSEKLNAPDLFVPVYFETIPIIRNNSSYRDNIHISKLLHYSEQVPYFKISPLFETIPQ